MKTTFNSALLAAALAPGLLLSLGGCAATQVALEHKDLSVQTQMSATVFLDLENRVQKTVFLDIKNTSSSDLAIEPLIKSRLEQAGYRIQSDPMEAFYILQVNVLHVGTSSPSALYISLQSGWGGPLAGGLAGAAIGGSTSSPNGNMKGALIGSAVELIAGSLVKNVTYSIITDIQITERSNEPVAQKLQSTLQQGTDTQIVQTSDRVSDRKKYRTRVVSSANKVNLKFEAALPQLERQLARSIAGIF
jgi:hypothetical protein